jgi:RNA polymerase sigma-70 factor (ECF subfamily)
MATTRLAILARTKPAREAHRPRPLPAKRAHPRACLILGRSWHLYFATVSNAAANIRSWEPEPVALLREERRGDEREDPRGDAALLRDVANGDPDALGELYDRYARAVLRVARRSLGNPEDAEDLVHMVFLSLRRIATSYDGRRSCWGWLCGITSRAAMRHRRGSGRFQRMLAAYSDVRMDSPPADPERRALSHEELRAFERALSRLGPKKRATYMLVELDGLSAQQAAIALDIPEATVRTRLFHARRTLHDALDRPRAARKAPGRVLVHTDV